MSKIAVVTDSTAVIEKELIDKYSNLYSIPLQIIIGNKTFNDGIDLTQKEFFNLMESSDVLPTTSQPLIGELTILFENLLKEYDHIIYITISSGISGTYQTGELVKEQVDDNRITVFDSTMTSVILKNMVLRATDMAKNGCDALTIIKELEYIRDNSSILLVVGDLAHLHRTGRISFAAASVGSILNIKPVLHFIDGKITVSQKVRTIKKAHLRIVDILKKANLSDTSQIMIAHANSLNEAETVRKMVYEVYPNHKVSIDALSPVISVHTGPGTVGLGWTER